MSSKTFSAELPKSLIPFVIKYSKKQKEYRNTALKLICTNVSRTKQNQILQKFGYNKGQANSLLIDIEGKLNSASVCRRATISTLEGKISSAQNLRSVMGKKVSRYSLPLLFHSSKSV